MRLRRELLLAIIKDRSLQLITSRVVERLGGPRLIDGLVKGTEPVAQLEYDQVALGLIEVRGGGINGPLHVADELRRRKIHCIFVISDSMDAIGDELLDRCPLGVVVNPPDEDQYEASLRLALHWVGELDALDQAIAKLASSAERAASELAILRWTTRQDPQELSHSWRTKANKVGLSLRETEVVQLLIGGQRVAAIARQLGLKVGSVRGHLKMAFRRCGVHSQSELIEFLTTSMSDSPGIDTIVGRLSR